MIRRLLALVAFVAALALAPSFALAQEEQKCEGPADLCAQVIELKKSLAVQKEMAAKAKADEAVAEKTAETKTEDKAARMIAFAAGLAVALKVLISLLTAWKGLFKTDKQKAWLKIGLVGGGFAVFLATNVGFGMSWWQSLILAGGGPGSILVHELGKLIPVLKGEKKYTDVDPDGDPTNTDPPENV